MRATRTTLALAAMAVAAPLGAPPTAAHLPLPRARAFELARQVLDAGTWGEQRAAFERLSEPEQLAVWRILTDVRPAPTGTVTRVRRAPAVGPAADPAVRP